MDWNVVITGAIISAISGIFIWFTQKYLPARDKRVEEALIRDFKQREGIQSFNQASQGTALDQTLATQKQLIDHVIQNNDGRLSLLTNRVAEGHKDLSDKLGQVIAGFNLLIVLMSRSEASRSITDVKDWSNASQVMEAIINSKEEQDVSDLSAAAGKGVSNE